MLLNGILESILKGVFLICLYNGIILVEKVLEFLLFFYLEVVVQWKDIELGIEFEFWF